MMLYVHVPFCRQKCRYCAFYSEAGDSETMTAYVRKLCDFLDFYNQTFETVYIGGGTPGVLPLSAWEILLDKLQGRTNGEFTVELNPESAPPALLALLKAGGVNRLSFGVQSLTEDELCVLGRIHSTRDALRALENARKAGFTNLSADLMYGLPEQSEQSFLYSLETLLPLVEHLSCYGLTVESGTPFGDRPPALPDEDAQVRLYHLLCTCAHAAGFEHYEISNFARLGFAAVHNSGYWSGKDYLGLGPSAHSLLDDKRCAFTPNLAHFLKKNDFLFDEMLPRTEADKRTERIMLGLRTKAGAPLELLDAERVSRFVSLGLGGIQNDAFILNEEGFLLSNAIMADLI